MLVRQTKRPRPCVGFQIGAARAPTRQRTGLAITQTVTLSSASVLFSSHSPLGRPLFHANGKAKSGQSESEQRPWLCQQERAVTVRLAQAQANCRQPPKLPTTAWDSLVLMPQHKVLAPWPRPHGNGGWQTVREFLDVRGGTINYLAASSDSVGSMQAERSSRFGPRSILQLEARQRLAIAP